TVPYAVHDGEWDHGDSTLRFGAQAYQLNYRMQTRFPRLPQRGETDYTFTDAPRVSTDRTTHLQNLSAYVEEIWAPAPELKLIPGLQAATLVDQSRPYLDYRF